MTAEERKEQGDLLDDLLAPIPRTAIVPAVRATLGLSQRQTDRIVQAFDDFVASRERDIVVTHVWLETTPPVHIQDAALPVRLRYDAPWETVAPVAKVPASKDDVLWLARCRVQGKKKPVQSRPVDPPPFGNVPRG